MADLGFFGKAARKGERLYPAYNVVAGAVVGDKETKFAQKAGEVPSRDLPSLVKDFLELYLSKAGIYSGFSAYIQKEGFQDLKKICERYKEIPDFEKDKNYYFDWGASEAFSLAGRGSGECSAGLSDLIEVDLKNIRDTKEKLSILTRSKEDEEKRAQHLIQLIFYSARMLLISKAIEPRAEKDVYENFRKHFIGTGLVDIWFADVLKDAEEKRTRELLAKEKDAFGLAEKVVFLYENMDSAFNFQLPGQEKTDTGAKASSKVVKDFRGVACPMNFVKTKMELANLKSGEILEIWLDSGEPIENVPGSVREEGHIILEQKKTGDHWSIIIEKK
jgi:sulfite reductase (ferredoxin)